jgi:WD40 repeat protein
MQKNPFKFLDSFTKDDREIFFGRDREIEELHSRVFESKVLVVYGTSGTGKSSLINCGLANRLSDSDWLPVSIRRGTNINLSLFEALAKNALTRAPFDKISSAGGTEYNLEKLLRSVYLDHFKPVFLIFDQFEELFIFGSREEKDELIKNVARVIDSDIQCRFIFSLREEYLAGVTEFEKVIPTFLSNRIRIEKMTRQNAVETIEGPCRINNIQVETGFAEALLEKLNPDTPEVELTWLQIFLDKLMKLAEDDDHEVNKFTLDLIEKAGEVKDILGTFLEEQISQLSDAEAGLVVLKSFVSVKGTKHQITEEKVIEYSGTFGKEIDSETVKELIQRFIRLRILRDKDEDGRYELRHDSLASKIFEKITIVEKELLEVKYFIENAYSNYVKRELLLSVEDLKYIAPYEDKLFLNEKSLNFIEQSKQALHRARRRRLNFAIAVVSIIIVILSFFTIWAMNSRKNAIILRQMALEQKDSAVRSKEEADSAKLAAINLQRKAEEKEGEAVTARIQSDIDRQKAIDATKDALQQKALAEKMSALANDKAIEADRQRQVADSQMIIAQIAEEKAKRLSLLSTAQNLALKSLSMDGNPKVIGLLAVQAFKFNLNNGGAINDPVIYKALEKAFTTLDYSTHSIYKGSLNEIRSIAINKDGLLSADMDENILMWDNSGNYSILPRSPLLSYINFISLSPDGEKVVTYNENNSLILRSLNQNNYESVLKGHISPVITAAWSNDGNLLATGGQDSLIIIWNTGVQPAVPIKTLKAASTIRSLLFCNTDSLLSVHNDGSINLLNVKNSTSELLFVSEFAKPICIAWNKPKSMLLVGSSDGNLILIDLNYKPSRQLWYNVHTAGISHLVFSHDFTLLATASWDKVIRLYNFREFFEMSNIIGGVINIDNLAARARSIIFTDDIRLVVGMSDKTIRIWETSSQKLASMICGIVNRDMTEEEWSGYIGAGLPYEKTCGNNP